MLRASMRASCLGLVLTAAGCARTEPAIEPEERAALDAALAEAGVERASVTFVDGLYGFSWRGAEGHARAHGQKDRLDDIRKRQDDMRNAVAVDHGHVVALRLARTRLTKLGALERLSHLVVLDVHDAAIAEPDGLGAFRELDHLDLSGNRLVSLAKIRGLPVLRSLYVADNPIERIDGLEDLPALEVLNLAGARVARVDGLGGLKRLRTLSLERNPIERMEGFDQNEDLVELNLAFCRISKIENVGALKRLQYLNLWHNRIARLSGVEVLPELVYLGIGENPYAWGDPENEAILRGWGAGRLVNAW